MKFPCPAKTFRFCQRWIPVLVLALSGLCPASSAQAGDLTVRFEEVGADVRITIDFWQVPLEVEVRENGAASLTTHVAYEVTDGEQALIQYALEGEEYWAVNFLNPDTNGTGTIDFSNLRNVRIEALAKGTPGGVKLLRDSEEGADGAVFAFQTYDQTLRVAAFAVELLLPNASLADLFVDPGLLFGEGFSVWSSDHFDVKFAAVPEPGVVTLAVGAGLWLMTSRRRREGRAALDSQHART